MEIKVDDLSGGEVIALLEEHLTDMYSNSPPESVHALDVDALKASNITFFSCWYSGQIHGCLAIKQLTSEHIELKSMRTANSARGLGIATKLLTHVLNFAIDKGFKKVSLETGTQEFFRPARNLYKKFGFVDCGPFAAYKEDSYSCFMTRPLQEKFV